MERTCGNCGHGSRSLVTCWERDPQGTHHAPSEPACERFEERKPESMCSCNRSRGYDELLQRHQQLEQVAREMHRIASTLADDFEFLSEGKLQGSLKARRNAIKKHREQMEALGVRVDD